MILNVIIIMELKNNDSNRGDAAFSIDTSYNVDIINATGGGTAPTNPQFVASYKNHMFYAGMSNAISTLQYSGPFYRR